MSKLYQLFSNKIFITVIWFGLSLFAVIKQVVHHSINNYHIYKFTFINLHDQYNLYLPQPYFFQDTNHYGILFAMLIAPFALLPDNIAVVLWVIANALALYIAIRMLPLKEQYKFFIMLICAHELMTASFSVQFNPMLTAFILFSFIFIRNKQEFWAAMFIVAGTYIKLYGIVGLAFFFFTDHKFRFIVSLIFWAAVLFALPILVASPVFVVHSYFDWYYSLSHKNELNEASLMQNISVMGIISRVFHYPKLSTLVVLLPAMALFGLSYIRYQFFKNTQYQLLILASTLIFTVIYSTGSESPTYIIAFAGVAIWYMNLNRPVKPYEIFLLIFAIVITSLSPSDLFPQFINRRYIQPYAIKALPCFVIWLKIIYEILTRDFKQDPQEKALLI